MSKTVKMHRGKNEADVHPDEVENYTFGGWAKGAAPRADGDESPSDDESDGDEKPELFSVYKLGEDGERGSRASKKGLTQDEADAYIAKNSDNEYEVEAETE